MSLSPTMPHNKLIFIDILWFLCSQQHKTQCWTAWKVNLLQCVYPLSKHAQLPPAYLQQIMLHNAGAMADSYFKFPQKASPPLTYFCRPQHSAGGEWSCVASLERVSYLVLSLRLCLGTDLCVCAVHNGCVYIGFSVHTFIHACTFVHTCRLCFFLSRERGEGFVSLGKPDRYWFHKVVARC